ncbi:MAG: hypothetical protein FWH21_10095, partial [Kiritimatiellaeota bacterium]|nr:hypothetical protein [Kiritimatiellota bacterium]
MTPRIKSAIIPVVLLGVCVSNAQQPNYPNVFYTVKLKPDKKERVAFHLTEASYTHLFLVPAEKTGYHKITDSKIYMQDDLLWHRVRATDREHYYAIDSATGPAYSSKEFVTITGHLGNDDNGGGNSRAPQFRVIVPSVDIDWVSQLDEAKEDTFVQFCPLTSDTNFWSIVEIKHPRDDYPIADPIVTVKWDKPGLIRLVRESDRMPLASGFTIDFRQDTEKQRFWVEPFDITPQGFEIWVEGLIDNQENRKPVERIPIDIVKGLVFKAELTNIKFNHDPNASTNDAVNIRPDFAGPPYDLSGGEWAVDLGLGAKNFPVCYVTNRSVTVQARVDFIANPNILSSAVVRAVAIDNGSETCLGDIARTNVAVNPQTMAWNYSTFQVVGKTPGAVGLARSNQWIWVVEKINGMALEKSFPFCTSGVHRVYTILDEPKPPWDNTPNNP